jgi:hypothetical protein
MSVAEAARAGALLLGEPVVDSTPAEAQNLT